MMSGMLGDRWGVTDHETALHYPCDDFVTAANLQAWRGVTVHATPAVVWSWVTQVRVAPYSYDWIDNRGRRSPRQPVDLPEPRVGEAFTCSGDRPLGRIVSVDRGRHLTATIMGAFMSYVLVPHDTTTRLLLKVSMSTSRITAPVICVGDLVMARRQLLNLKRLAERAPDHPAARSPRPRS